MFSKKHIGMSIGRSSKRPIRRSIGNRSAGPLRDLSGGRSGNRSESSSRGRLTRSRSEVSRGDLSGGSSGNRSGGSQSVDPSGDSTGNRSDCFVLLEDCLKLPQSNDSSEKPTGMRRLRADLRRQRHCPYCNYVGKSHLERHLLSRHRDQVGSEEVAKRISAAVAECNKRSTRKPFQVPKRQILQVVGEQLWEKERDMFANLMTLLHVEVVQENAQLSQMLKETVKLPRPHQASPKSVRQKKRENGLSDHVSADDRVRKLFTDHAMQVSNEKTAKLQICRLSNFLAFSIKHESVTQHPEQERSWWALVSIEAAVEYVGKLVNIVSAATILTFCKAVRKACQLTLKRWLLDENSGVPQGEGFRKQLKRSRAFWEDEQANFEKKVCAEENQKSAEGRVIVADLSTVAEYLRDKEESREVVTALELIEKHFETSCTIPTNNLEVRRAWNRVTRYLIICPVVMDKVRTGVVQFVELAEFAAATKTSAGWIVHVAKHKNAQHGMASFGLTNDLEKLWRRFSVCRQKLGRCLPINERSSWLFVNASGGAVKEPLLDINKWMIQKGYDTVNTGGLRRAMETAAAAYSFDIQRDVSHQLGHSMHTANRNYKEINAPAVEMRRERNSRVSRRQEAVDLCKRHKDQLVPFPDIQNLKRFLQQKMVADFDDLDDELYKMIQSNLGV